MVHLLAKIDSILRISGGVLLNSPSVNSIEDIKISSSKIKRGDLFIDINNTSTDIEEAVENGAYCILTASIPKICDEEIAWISVEDLETSLIKLTRFYATDKSFRFIPLLNVHYALAKSIHVEEKMKLLSSSPAYALIQILKSEKGTLFFVPENSFIQKVDPSVKKFIETIEPEQIFENGIFHTSFVYKEQYIKDIRLSSFFVPYLCSLMNSLNELEISFKIENFNNFEHFYPQFVGKKLEKCDFGTSRKVIIFESNLELFQKELSYLEKKVNKNLFVSFTCKDSAIKELPNLKFRYALLYGNKDDFSKLIIENKITQMELF